MSSQAISDVGMSLKQLLLGEKEDNFSVTFLNPDESGAEPRVNLFLYKIKENASLKNMDWQVKKGDAGKIVPPPLSLNLFYLVTVYAKSEDEGNNRAHQILGDVMRIFYENAIIPKTYLGDELAENVERIKITMQVMDVEELSKIWSTFTKPYRLSVPYEVSVAQIAMNRKRETSMAPRVKKIGAPEINAPFLPPVVDEMSPAQGPIGTIVTFKGKNLVGWYAYVRISGLEVPDQGRLTQNEFQVTIPAGLSPGFHELRVDISHIFRRVFFFEVVA